MHISLFAACPRACPGTELGPELRQEQRLLGWPAGELPGRNAHAALHGQKPEGSVVASSDCPLSQAVEAGLPYHAVEEWFVRKDGSFLPVSVIGRPVLRQGQLRGSVISFEDISQSKRIEAIELRLGESLRRLSEIAALSHLPVGGQLYRALAVGVAHLGLPFGIVSKIAGERQTIIAQVSSPPSRRRALSLPI